MADRQLLESSSEEVVSKLIESQDADEIQRLTQLFNVNQLKKDALRVLKLNDILDKLDDQVAERVEKYPDQFSNADLLNYVNAVQQNISKSAQSVGTLNQTPLIQFNQQNNISVEGTELNRESREKIVDIVRQFLNSEKSVEIEPENVIYYNDEGDE